MKSEATHLKEKILKEVLIKTKEIGANLIKLDESSFRKRIESIFRNVLREHKDFSLNEEQQEILLHEVVAHFLGLGPLEKLLKDPTISEIMVNGAHQVYVERAGNLELTDIDFGDEEQLSYFIAKILTPSGRRATESEPYVDARLSDGSRVNIVKPPVSIIGPLVTIRKLVHKILTIDDLIHSETLDVTAADFLKACVIAKMNILVCGGASSGKTTLLNALAPFIPQGERVITIEDTVELHLEGKHVVALETRLSSIEGKGEITIRDLLRNALHMRPDRIIIGEVRSDEVLDMIQAMNTGHEGSMTTLHANSPLDALDRLEVLAIMGKENISSEVAKRQIINAIDLIVQMERLPAGTRKIIQVSEVLKGKEYALSDIFVSSDDPQGITKLRLNLETPTFYPRLKKRADYFLPEFEKAA